VGARGTGAGAGGGRSDSGRRSSGGARRGSRRSSGGARGRSSGRQLGRSSRRAWAGAAVRRLAGAGAGGGGDPQTNPRAGGGGEFVNDGGLNWNEPRRQETRREKAVCGFFLARRQDLWRRARCHAGLPRHEGRRHRLWRRAVLPRRHRLWAVAPSKGSKTAFKIFLGLNVILLLFKG
jgi:hypothetical protein